MLIFLYNILFTMVACIGMPYFFYKLITKKKYQDGIKERLGFISKDKFQQLKEQRIWIHAVSVGEASATYPLYTAIKEKYPMTSVVFSTTTKTGQEWIRDRLLEGDVSVYFPLDLLWVVKKVLNTIRPLAVIIAETEIWPNFWNESVKRGIKLALINGRVSNRSFHRYQKGKFFIGRLLNQLSFLGAQTEEDALRFRKLGVDSQKVKMAGNLKFDAALPQQATVDVLQDLRQNLQLVGDEIILIGGSTHEGEEAILIQAYKELRRSFPMLRLILVPRHPERFGGVNQLIKEEGFHAMCDSDLHGERLDGESILLVDQMGRLALYYALASIAFIGKSLTARGGQNFLEAAAYEKVILFGPHMDNFKSVARLFLREGGAKLVMQKEDLVGVLTDFLQSKERRDRMGRIARQLVEKNKGSVSFYLKEIESRVLCRG